MFLFVILIVGFFYMLANQQGVANWKYLAVYYELVEKEKTFECGCAEEKICFGQVYHL
jgi:hypothetical protein